MTKKLFVGGLSWNTDDEGLRQAFERFGTIDEAKVIVDRDTGRSRGFGFVTFSSPDAVQSAITAMDGTTLDGRNIKVNAAEERPRDGGGRSGGGRSSFGGGGPRHGGGGGGGFGGGNRW